MATYVPNPSDVSEPLDTRPASTAAAEFRALKTFLTSVVAGGLPPITGKDGWMLLADEALPGAKWVEVKSTVLPAQAGATGKILSTDGTNSGWATFYSFMPSMAGKSGQLVRVNPATSAYEYATFFSQFPGGTPGSVLRLSTGGTDLEWTTAPALGAATAALADATSNTSQIATTAWVRQATFGLANNGGADSLFDSNATSLTTKLQGIRDNIRYIKETQIPGVLAGNAASATNAANLGGVSAAQTLQNRGVINDSALGSTTANGFYRVEYEYGGFSRNLLVFNADGSTGTVQMEFHYNGISRWRNKTDNTNWTAWKVQLDEFSFNSYAPSLTGTGASGTWNIAISGHANSATFGNRLNTTSHAGTFWVEASWDGTRWYLTSNHGASVRVGWADAAGTASSAGSASTWTTARNLTIGAQTNSVNGSSDVNFNLASMGVQPAVGGNGLGSITLTTTPGAPSGGSPGDIVGVY